MTTARERRILVTGGAGFIGSHLVEALAAHSSSTVLSLDNYSTGQQRNEITARNVLWHDGANRIEYWKVGTDGRTKGSGNLPQAPPVYEFAEICVGVVICMDINAGFGAFCWVVTDRIRSSTRPWKFLCVPADMARPLVHGQQCGAGVCR